MNLRSKINLFSLLIFLTVSTVFIFAGNLVLEKAMYQQHQQFLKKEIKLISNKLKEYPSVLDSDESKMLQNLINDHSCEDNPVFIITLDGKEVLHHDLPAEAPIPPEFIREMLDQDHGQSVYHYNNRRWLSAFQSLPEKNLLAVISISFDKMFNKKSEYLFQLFLIVLLIFFLNILILNNLISTIVRRINTILDSTRNIAGGDFSCCLEKKEMEKDEIGSLQKSIIQMAEKIKDRLQTQSAIESALKESENRLNLALDAANCGLWEYNPTTRTNVHFADRWFSMLGYTPAELPHTTATWFGLMHPDDKARTQSLMQDHINDRRVPFDTEFRMKAKNGGYRWIHSVGKIISDDEGLPNRMIGLHMDITKQKEAENTQKSMEIHMRRSQKIEAAGTLASGISHGFNNVLNSILRHTEMAMNDINQAAAARSSLKKIILEGEKAKALITQIQTFSQQNEGEQKPLHIAQVVKEMLTMLRAAIPASIDIRSKITAHSTVFGDPVQINQVLVNLCTNAERAMQGRTGILTVTLTDVLVDSDFAKSLLDIRPGRYVKLGVGDTGCGMSRKLLERIFDPFFTTKENKEGAGLGLSIAHGIIRRHNGCINVTSKTGEGSTFNIFLPVYEVESNARELVTSDIPGGTESILFVDDETPVLKTGKILMERLGYKVTTEKDSRQALEMFNNDPARFDLVLTDISMPHMEGDVLAYEMIRIRPDIPVILCTGFSARMNEEKSKEIGIRAFISKPLLLWELADTIRKVLDSKKEQKVKQGDR